MIRRPPRSTLSSSSAASDVYKRQLQELVAEFQKKRAAVTEADVDYFMSVAKFNNQPERAVNQTTSGDGMAGLHEYLARHNLEGAMDEAANHVAKTQPADPMKALSEYFAKLAKR
eukprot:TRINITY_DN18977_c0_g1_i2.p1 TRINITY_DN18977_c0_g1~~TRINITY_DN18977_c0_g1_i2.p1  ORF type:complete len:115 (+),score=44.69 TRINITY_DN18977_c0_g1_i2:153-497(+)